MIQTILEYKFLQYAILGSILASIVCGIIGVIVVEKKLLMMSGGISHTALGGVGFGYLMNFEPMLGAVLFAVVAALTIGYVNKSKINNSDVIIAMFWSLGMALGIIFIAMMPGYPPDLNSYLFGNILSITANSLKIMGLLTFLVVFIIFAFFADWKLWLFDAEFAKLSGLNVKLMENTMLVLIALSVVVMIRVTGIILVIALLSIPSATAALLTKKLSSRIFIAMLFGGLFCLLGLFLSFITNVSSGAVIIILAVASYAVTYLLTRKKYTSA